MHSLHVWLTVSAIHNNTQSDVQCAEYVLMFVCLVSKRGGEDSPEIEMSHENIRMENHFSVKASFIIARKKPRLVCSIWAPFLPSFTSATPMYLTQCQLWLPLLSYLSLYSCQVMFVTKDWRVFFFWGNAVNIRGMMMTELQHMSLQSSSLWMLVRRGDHRHE